MPKKSKNSLKYVRKYQLTDLVTAIKQVKTGSSVYSAAKSNKIPYMTLSRHLKDSENVAIGRQPHLSISEEQELVKWIKSCAALGYPRTWAQIRCSAAHICKTNHPPDCQYKDRPTGGWVNLFKRRHPDLRTRTREGVSKATANVSEKDIRKWFVNVETYLEDEKLRKVLNDPSRVFGGDEIGFCLFSGRAPVVVSSDATNTYDIQSNAKTNHTVLYTFCADGSYLKPHILYPGKRGPKQVCPDVTIDVNESGWMTGESFSKYLTEQFIPQIRTKGINDHVIFFVDGHKSHGTREVIYYLQFKTYRTSNLKNLCLQVSKICVENKIILVKLYPNSTCIYQPADVALFRGLKAEWDNLFQMCQLNYEFACNKSNFPWMINVIGQKRLTVTKIRNAFSVCGLHPWDPNAVNYKKCLGAVKIESVSNDSTDVECIKELSAIDGSDDLMALNGSDALSNFEPVKMEVIFTGDSTENIIIDLSEAVQESVVPEILTIKSVK